MEPWPLTGLLSIEVAQRTAGLQSVGDIAVVFVEENLHSDLHETIREYLGAKSAAVVERFFEPRLCGQNRWPLARGAEFNPAEERFSDLEAEPHEPVHIHADRDDVPPGFCEGEGLGSAPVREAERLVAHERDMPHNVSWRVGVGSCAEGVAVIAEAFAGNHFLALHRAHCHAHRAGDKHLVEPGFRIDRAGTQIHMFLPVS